VRSPGSAYFGHRQIVGGLGLRSRLSPAGQSIGGVQIVAWPSWPGEVGGTHDRPARGRRSGASREQPQGGPRAGRRSRRSPAIGRIALPFGIAHTLIYSNMHAHVTLVGTDVICRLDSDEVRLPISEPVCELLEGWESRYRATIEHDEPIGSLTEIGREMFGWIDGSGWAARWRDSPGARWLEIAVDSHEDRRARLLLDLPWEILADKQSLLAADATQPLVVVRRIGRNSGGPPVPPSHSDLAIVFMAASPRGQTALDFEAEETAILSATERLPVQIVVEESGCGAFLKDRLSLDGPFEVVHISCHGSINRGVPQLALETPEGDLEPVDPGAFANVLGEDSVPLVFVSACRTAASEGGFTESFVRSLVRSGARNVLGWDGSVYDSDATRFARTFYHELSSYASVPFAAATARRELLQAQLVNASTGRHWHLARVYAGPGGAGQCCERGLGKRRIRKNAGYREFLDKASSRIPVATAKEFVGRRKQAQDILRAFRDADKDGVLIVGMGNIGKSSLAARVANRLPQHHTVIVYERYDALAILDQLVSALPPGERHGFEETWRPRVADDGMALTNALEEMLTGPFERAPILLIVDDLEQVLETPRPGDERTPVADAPGSPEAWRHALTSVLTAFAAADSKSRLLLTSRFDFTLLDGRGHDLAERLARVPLLPMDADDRAKQWRAAESTVGGSAPSDDGVQPLVSRALREAGGNPGLQEILCRPILSGEITVALAALDAVASWRASGEVPDDESAAQEFFQRVSLETYRHALTDQELKQLQAGTIFSEGLPVPVGALEAAGRALGVIDPPRSLQRLIALGLVDDWGSM
jgi:hypothetical protein